MLLAAVLATGVFAVILGVLHFTFPRRFGFLELLAGDQPAPPPFRLGPYRKDLSRSDVLGVVYVMNHCASFVILSIGAFDLCAPLWLGASAGAVASLWAAGFWWVRAVAQVHVGRRRGDWLVMAFFTALGVVQALAAT